MNANNNAVQSDGTVYLIYIHIHKHKQTNKRTTLRSRRRQQHNTYHKRRRVYFRDQGRHELFELLPPRGCFVHAASRRCSCTATPTATTTTATTARVASCHYKIAGYCAASGKLEGAPGGPKSPQKRPKNAIFRPESALQGPPTGARAEDGTVRNGLQPKGSAEHERVCVYLQIGRAHV